MEHVRHHLREPRAALHPERSFVFRWVFGFAKRFVLFIVFTIGLAQGVSWLFGYDDEFKAWAGENRPLIGIVLVLSAIMYAVYDWLEVSDRQKEE